nr:MAG TPA: hypothetical protein [Caudoviricetes sp.]
MGAWFFVALIKFCKAIIDELFSLVNTINEENSLMVCTKITAFNWRF